MVLNEEKQVKNPIWEAEICKCLVFYLTNDNKSLTRIVIY